MNKTHALLTYCLDFNIRRFCETLKGTKLRSNIRWQRFPCQNEQCLYTSTDFSKTLSDVWDKHGVTVKFSY